MTERELDAAVAKLAKLMGIKVRYHPRNSIGSQAGWPDWSFISDGGAIFRENKTEIGRLTSEQRITGYVMQAARLDWALWRPADLRSGRIAAELEAIR